MKIAHNNRMSEKDTLQMLLQNSRDTPHSGTGVAPSATLFRDGSRSIFPSQSITKQQVQAARKRDKDEKVIREENIISTKYRIPSGFKIGDKVIMLRNYKKKQSKFDPVFTPEACIVIKSSVDQQYLIIER